MSDPPLSFTWARYGPGYEVSSRGDRRFSAFYARFLDGVSIEEAYQCGVKGYASLMEGKGKPPKEPMSREALWERYLDLWRRWARWNPVAMRELRVLAAGHGYVLCDRFATTPINQAHALSVLLNEGAGL